MAEDTPGARIGRMLSQAEMRDDIAERIADMSPPEQAAFRAATEFVLKLATDILSASEAEREALYQLAKVEGTKRGLVVSGLPEAFDSDAERFFRGFLPVVAAAEHVTRGAHTTH